MSKGQGGKPRWEPAIAGLLGLGGTLAAGMLLPAAANAATVHPPRSLPAPLLYQAQSLPDFDEEDALDQADLGFHSIFVDNRGNVLGTFVYIPGAKVKVFASGNIAIEEQDYTYEVKYDSNGRLQAIGTTDFTYYSHGRIRSIGSLNFAYFSRGELSSIGDVEIRYFTSGRVSNIDEVEFEYDASGRLKQINRSTTDGGIEIVVVN